MIAPATNPASALLRPPANAFEWALGAAVWGLALVAPVALTVLLWPAMTGAFGVLLFGLTVTLGFIISAFSLWLLAPLAVMMALLATGLIDAARSLHSLCKR